MATATQDPSKPTSVEAQADARLFEDMKEYFAGRPKKEIKTREDEWVQINGYTFVIQAGEKVEVPVDVADLLEQSGRI